MLVQLHIMVNGSNTRIIMNYERSCEEYNNPEQMKHTDLLIDLAGQKMDEA